MINFKNIFIAIATTALFYACKEQSKPFTTIDHEAQAIKDKDTINKFLSKFYFDDTIDSIKPVLAGKTSLLDDSRLKKVTVNEYDIDYTYYYFVIEQGKPDLEKSFPTVVDSLFVTYDLKYFTKSDTLVNLQVLTNPTWFKPSSIAVRGWMYSFTHFKSGKNITTDGPITYKDFGKGFFILPSGLCYRNNTFQNLVYYVNLYDYVANTDGDSDRVPSIFEDIDGNGKPWDDDTDKDGKPNYIDTDDDGDGVLTKYEDANGDGNPRNDFSDPNNPDTPDYLNFKVRISKE